MIGSTLRRSAVVTGAVLATAAMALSTASVAGAAPAAKVRSQAGAHAAYVKIGTNPPTTVSRVHVAYNGQYVEKSGPTASALPGQGLVSAGVFATKAVAGNDSSYGCAGVLSQGGQLDIGDGTKCKAETQGSGGVKIDLGSLTSSLPVGVGALSITANAITANARFVNGQVSGFGRIANPKLNVCLGVVVNGACVGSQQSVALGLRGVTNEDLLPAIIGALTKSPALAALAQPIGDLLNPVVKIRLNVQTVNRDTGVLNVSAVRILLLGRTVGTITLGDAQAGPTS
jgi:hypothetical protein